MRGSSTIVAAALFAFGCGARPLAPTRQHADEPGDAGPISIAPPRVPAPSAQLGPPPARLRHVAHDSIELVRTMCFGYCPAYDLVIDADGTVTWDGKEFVDAKGTRTEHVDPARVRKLIAFMQHAGFLQLKSRYQCPVTDQFWAITTLEAGGRSKTVRHYVVDRQFLQVAHVPSGCAGPIVLTEIEVRIEQLAGVERWVGNGGQAPDGGPPQP